MYRNQHIRSPKPWASRIPLPRMGSAFPVAIKPLMANPLDELCWSFHEPTVSQSPISPPQPVSHLTGNLLLKCLQDSLEKQQLQERLASLASELGVGPDGDSGVLLNNISSLIAKSERKRQAVEKRAKAIENKYLDSAMQIQVLEMQLAEAKQQRDDAVKNLQDLTWQPALVSPPDSSLTSRTSWCSGGNPQTPSTAPLGNRVEGTSPSTPETAPIESIPLPLIPPSPSPQASGTVAALNGTPPTVPLSALAPVVRHRTPNQISRSPSVNAAVGGATASPSSRAATAPASSHVWGVAELKSFHQGGGDIILGSGVHGTVHLYRHRVTDQPIAVKTFELPNDVQGMTSKVKAIESEAFIIDILGREECFPSYLGCLEINPGTIGLAMDFIGDTTTGESWTLSRGMRKLVLSQQDWFGLALDVAKSLGLIHAKGYLMNDLKEDNCLLRKTHSGRWQAVIVDFGLACPRNAPYSYCFSSEDKEKYRRREVYVHIAPECALDDENTSVSSDVFQLGRLLSLMGDATTNADLTAIGNICRQNSHLCRPSIDEVVDELERVM